MLQTIRENSQGIIAKVIVGLIIVTFALFGVESLIGLANSERAPAEVNGQEISNIDLQREVELQRRQILSQMGEDADPAAIDEVALRRAVLDRLIDREILLQSAKGQDLYISEQMIDQIIVADTSFQGEDGRFDRNQFEAVLRTVGLTPLMYRDQLRKALLTAQERNAYALSSFATPAQAEQLAKLAAQTRDIDWVTFSLEESLAKVEITQEQLQARYDENPQRFMTEAQVVLSYIELNQSDFADPDSVTEADIRSAYEQELARFQADEERQAAHILFELGEGSEGDARDAAEAVRERILSGELSFAAAAAEFSADPGSATAGGDLGFNGRGVFVGPFEDTLFAMQEGEISAPVRTEFGYHLIQLNAVRATEAPSYAERAPALKAELAAASAEADYVEALDRLADLSFSAADLQVPAEELGLEIQQTEAFGQSGGNTELTANPKVLRAAFSNELLDEELNSSPIELSRERAVVIRVQQEIPARQQTLAEVQDLLESELRQEQAMASMKDRAEQLVEALSAGQTLEQVDPMLAWNSAEGVARDAGSMPLNVNRAAFELPRAGEGKPSLKAIELVGGDYAVVRVRGVHEPEEIDELLAEQLKQSLGARQADSFFSAHVQGLNATAEVERN
ncbi:SurA N-terminal domain-containing protein [Marinobacterium sediminicola]|uniref:Periplasmic chaperone PpiD n=1 Tax=Marinobacterium sediminicola TaxID=518898 RepID=A0ABY1RX63_9GAMM|nr:SurA N-terminal domain-containing protein [Marinobacterium sediminicola]ULG67877.1 SurA N-terminal domain-containing protein [Marinobacterium sediminicola]SMR71419.1 peptidyl-prolyl cis-trans isomerase D [Marinobacterium sediminicola]